MSPAERMERLAGGWDAARRELVRYASRLVMDPELARDLVQTAALRAVASARAPEEPRELRKWLFRVVSNLAIDELRRRGRWTETALLDSRAEAESDEAFVAASIALRGTPEMAAIAAEHLAFCFACTLRSFEPERAASLLLIEVYGFTVAETAGILRATAPQVKHWIQQTRAAIDARHGSTCALVNKEGICHQCSELATFFNGAPENPLQGKPGGLDDRLRVVRGTEQRDLSLWHRRLLEVIRRRATPDEPR